MNQMSEKRFKSTLDEDTMSIMPYLVSDNEEEAFYNLQGCVDLLNEMSETIVEQQSFIGRELLKFDKYLAERLIEKEEIIKEQETIINQLDQKIKDKNEYQRVLEAKIRRLKDRIKVLEK